MPIQVDNDANAAALAEASGAQVVVTQTSFMPRYGTVSVLELFSTATFFVGKPALRQGGHLGIDHNGPVCNCGKRGCIETLAAGPAIARRARQKLERNPNSILWEMAGGDLYAVSSEMVETLMPGIDPVAKEVMRETLDDCRPIGSEALSISWSLTPSSSAVGFVRPRTLSG